MKLIMQVLEIALYIVCISGYVFAAFIVYDTLR